MTRAHPVGPVEARGLTWTPLGRAEPILAGVDLRVEAGERVLLAGASGAGKSTLLRALAGVLGEAEAGDLSGEVLVDGAPVRAGDGRVGLLVQDPAAALVAGRVGRDVAFGPENLGVPRTQIHERVAEALTAVGFPYGPQHRTTALSGGEAQRLALAGVLAMRPDVLLLDEPTAMLDDDSAGQVREAVVRAVADRRRSLVVVEHRLDRWSGDDARGFLDRLVVLGRDGVIADGPPDRVLRDQRDMLLAAGIWLPGVPAPDPIDVAVPAPARPLATGEVVRLDRAGLVRRPRRGLSVTHRPQPVVALHDVDLTVEAAALTVVRGRSGAGKSSLLSLAAGLERPTSGRVVAAPTLAGGAGAAPSRWTSTELAARVAWVPQRASLTIAGRTVLDSLLTTARALGRDGSTAQAHAAELMADLRLTGLESRDPHTLSGGELRRLALASALVHGPSLLALDEPTVGQDRHTWSAVAGICRSAAAAGLAVLVSTHDDDLAAHADVSHVLDGGRLTEVGA